MYLARSQDRSLITVNCIVHLSQEYKVCLKSENQCNLPYVYMIIYIENPMSLQNAELVSLIPFPL